MSGVVAAVVGVVAFIVAAYFARLLARAIRHLGSRVLVAVGVVIVIAATALAWWGASSGSDAAWGIALGAGFGGLSGLRYGNGTLFDLLARRPGEPGGERG
jgi:hypothetical protein